MSLVANPTSAEKGVIGDVAGSAVHHVSARLEDTDLGRVAQQLIDISKECNGIAHETVQLCTDVETKGTAMVSLGQEIKSTLDGFTEHGMDASSLATVRELISGDKMKSALFLAHEVDDLALACVEKSVQMIEIMDGGLESLPDVVEGALDRVANIGPRNGEDSLITDVEKDVHDIEACIDNIQKLNLFTALTVGIDAINSLASKTNLAMSAFASIREFAKDIVNITDSFSIEDLNPLAIMSRATDLWRCICLSDVMKQCAEQVQRLMTAIIQLFRETSTNVSGLWAALAFAKDCMADCVEHATSAKTLCVDARDKGTTLVDTSLKITDDIKTVGKLDASSITALVSLVASHEIQDAIDLATGMDDVVESFADKVVAMVDRVTEGYMELPVVLTEGLPENPGTADDDPEPANLQKDIEEIDQSREAVEEANVLTASQAAIKGFSGVYDKSKICRSLLTTVEEFADMCIETINSFLGVWNLEAAQQKIMEMCRLAKLGDMMRQFAAQIKAMLKSIVVLMRAIVTKFKSMSVSGAVEDVTNVLDDLLKQVLDAIKPFQKIFEAARRQISCDKMVD